MEKSRITIYTKEEFRKWLIKHHTKESKVAVVLYKRHTRKPAPSHRELMHEAICFGWIDTTIKKIDEDRFIRHFSKRTKNSRWSNNTIKYAKQLIQEGKMTRVGMEYYKLGLARPTHDHGLSTNPNIPKDLKSALAKNTKAQKSFKKYPPSAKRMLYRWVLRAKLPATRDKRIRYIVQNAVTGIRLF